MGKKELYQKIIEDIFKHKDYGKKNPIDLGIECGYSQQDIFAALNMPHNIEEKENKNLIYFILNGQVVSLDLIGRKVTSLKKLDVNSGANVQVKNGFLVWDNSDGKFHFGSGPTKLYWENLETREKGEFSLPEPGEDNFSIFKPYIRSFYIAKEAIWVDTFREIYKVKFNREVCRINKSDFGVDISFNVVTEDAVNIYIADMYGVCVIKKDSAEARMICRYSADDNKRIILLEFNNGKVYYHVFNERIWNSNYSRYSVEGENVSEYAFLQGNFTDPIGFVANPIELFVTRDFVLHQNAIYKKNSSSPVWGSNESLAFVRQVVPIFEENIFLGIPVRLWDKDQIGVTIFDLNKRNQPVLLPLNN